MTPTQTIIHAILATRSMVEVAAHADRSVETIRSWRDGKTEPRPKDLEQLLELLPKVRTLDELAERCKEHGLGFVKAQYEKNKIWSISASVFKHYATRPTLPEAVAAVWALLDAAGVPE